MPARDPAWPTLLRRFRSETTAGYSDRELVDRFVQLNDQAAFEALLDRHGPMVLGVCRRAAGGLGDDAFQATFLVLARRAAGVRGSVAGWLYAVARRLSRKAARSEAARRRLETAAASRRDAGGGWQELLLLLDEELDRLPDEYRAPLVLCYHQERTQDEAAARLGWSLSTLRRRLERGREMLRRRMARHGVSLSAVALARPAAVGGALREAALGCIQGLAPASVVALAEGGSAMLVVSKWLALAALSAAVAVGVAAVPGPQATRNPVVNPEPAPAEPPLPKGAVARLGTLLFRHGGIHRDSSLTFSPDGKRLISTGAGRVRCWNVVSGEQLLVVGDGGGDVLGEFPMAQVTANARFARLTRWAKRPNDPGAEKWASTLYDLSKGKEVSTSRLETPRDRWRSFAIGVPTKLSPTGEYLADISRDGVVLFSAASGAFLRYHRMSNSVYTTGCGVAFHPDGKSLLLGDAGYQFTLFDLATGEGRRSFGIDVKDGFVDLVTISPDGKWFATVGFRQSQGTIARDKFVRLWDLSRGAVVRTLDLLPADEPVLSLCFTPDSRTVIAGILHSIIRSHGAVVRTWDVATGKGGRGWTDDSRVGLYLAVHPDGKLLATMNGSGVIQLWNMATGKNQSAIAGSPCGLADVAYTPDGSALVTVGHDMSLRQMEATTGRLLVGDRAPRKGVRPLLSPTGNYLFASEVARQKNKRQARFRVWRAKGGNLVLERDGSSPLFAPDESRLAFLDSDGRVQVLDFDTMKVVHTLTPPQGGKSSRHPQPVPRAFTHGGRKLILQGGEVSIWDLLTGKQESSWNLIEKNVLAKKEPLQPNSRDRIEHVIASGDGVRIAFSLVKDKAIDTDSREPFGRIMVFEADGKLLRQIDLPSGSVKSVVSTVCLRFSPDGKRLAGGGARCATVWDIATGQALYQLEGHRGRVNAVAFRADGKRLATASEDSTVLLWDVSK